MLFEPARRWLRVLIEACCDGLYKSMPIPFQDEVSDNH